MGEYAEYALQDAMRRGIPVAQKVREPSPSRQCPLCEKELRGGFDGMVDHLKAKHAMRDKDARAKALLTPKVKD